jgi:acetyltransferase-like isoleucine patch superfamily enzyme
VDGVRSFKDRFLTAVERPDGVDLVERWRYRRDILYTGLVRGQFGALPRSSIIRWPFEGRGFERIFIGEEVVLNPGCGLGTGERGQIRIGSGTAVTERLHVWAEESVTIGERVLIAHNVHIHDSRHCTDDHNVAIQDQGMCGTRPIRIKEGAWLGANAVILAGVTVGRNAVVGANAVVTSDVPDFGVAVGVPARVVSPSTIPSK